MKRLLVIAAAYALVLVSCSGGDSELSAAEDRFIEEARAGIEAAVADGGSSMLGSNIAMLDSSSDQDLLLVTKNRCDWPISEGIRTHVEAEYGLLLLERYGSADAWSDEGFGELFDQLFFVLTMADRSGLCDVVNASP